MQMHRSAIALSLQGHSQVTHRSYKNAICARISLKQSLHSADTTALKKGLHFMFFLNCTAANITGFRGSQILTKKRKLSLVTRPTSCFGSALHRDPKPSNALKTRLEYTNVADFYVNGKKETVDLRDH